MNIKRLNAPDAKQYATALETCLRLSLKGTIPNDYIRIFAKNKMADLHKYIEAESAYVLGAIDEDDLAGFVWGYIIEKPDERFFHVGYIAVLEEYQGRGVGKKLIAATKKLAAELGCCTIELIVDEQNRRARLLYESNGFTTDRLIMRCRNY